MSTVPAHHIDPIADSQTHLISVVFLKTRSPLYSYAVSIAQNAEKYQELNVGGKPIHSAVFPRTELGAARAAALLDLVKNWQGIQIYTNGQLQTDTWLVRDVLNCYLKALKNNDPTAHCHVRIECPFRESKDLFAEGITITEILDIAGRDKGEYDTYIFPCRFIGHMRLYSQDAASVENQIQSEGIRRGCSWCPLFDVKTFRKIK